MLMFTGSQSELPPSISGLAWGDAFLIGGGIDAITGAVSSTPLAAFDLTEDPVSNARIRHVMISDESEYSQEIGVGAKDSFNINGITVDGSASYLTKVQYSSTSLTILAQVAIDQAEYQMIKSPMLTPSAQQLLTSDQVQFKSTFGEYFLSGVKKGSTLTVILTCTSNSSSTMNDFKSIFSVTDVNLFTASGFVKFKSEARKKNVSIYFDAVATGFSGTIPSSQDPETLMNWFLKNARGVSKFAYLSSYSNLDHNFSRDVDIDPAVFARVQALYQRSWVLSNRYITCPANYRSAFSREYNLLIKEVNISKPTLTRDLDKVVELDSKMGDLLGKIGEVFNRLDLYQTMKGLEKTEPKKDQHIESSKGQYFLYGINNWKQRGISVTTKSDRYAAVWHDGWREHTFDFSNDSNALMIGWMMTNNWRNDTNGKFWKVSDQIIGTSSAKVHVESYHWRGTDWSINVYQVDKSLYNFGKTIEEMTSRQVDLG